MIECLGLLFADGSMLTFPEGVDVDQARIEADEHDQDDLNPRTRIVRSKIEIVEHIDRSA